jgi:uncharacterized membrane protein YphA (DoxX/SURF4 family)
MTTASASTTPATPSKGLHIGLWVVQVLLALAFGASGLMKMTTPIADLAKNMPWVADMPGLVRFIGTSEFLGAVGLILPAALRIVPKLTGIAAAALVVVMVLAFGFHIMQHDEFGHMMPSVVLGALAAFVAWGRLVGAPIAPKA